MMPTDFDLMRLNNDIRLIKQAAERLAAVGEAFPALEKNAKRILASVKMLEINISDPVALGD